MATENIIPKDTESRKILCAEIFDDSQSFIYDEDQIAWNLLTHQDTVTSHPRAQSESLNDEASEIRKLLEEIKNGSFGDSVETIVFQTSLRHNTALYFEYIAEARENLARALTNAADYFETIEDDIQQLARLAKAIESNKT